MKNRRMLPSRLSTGTAFLLVAVATSVSSFGQSRVVLTVPFKLQQKATTVTFYGDPEPDMNCDELVFPRANLKVLIQNDRPSDPDRSAELRSLGKSFVRDAVLPNLPQSHPIHGIELEWFLSGYSPVPPPQDRMPIDVELWSADELGEPQDLLARVYLYRRAQYNSRTAALEGVVGHPLRSFDVWADNVVTHLGPSGNGFDYFDTLLVVGGGSEFYGPIASDTAVKLTGGINVFHDEVLYTTWVYTQWYDPVSPYLVAEAEAPSFDHDVDEARAYALEHGSYFPASVDLAGSNLPPSGVIFAEGDIRFLDSNREGRWTFVSAAGDVKIEGDDNRIRCFALGVTAAAFSGRVRVTGDDNSILGELLAPEGLLKISGSRNSIHGILVAESVVIAGQDHLISDGTHPIP